MLIVDAPLVSVADMAGQRGSPHTEAGVLSAGAEIRRICGWHIAPQVTFDVVLDSDGGRVLHLPAAEVVEVASVEDVTGETPKLLSGWRVSRAGMLQAPAGTSWPCGFSAVRVRFTAGYASCPPELLPIIATRAMIKRLVSGAAGPWQEAYDVRGQTAEAAGVLAKHTLGYRP